MSKVVVAGAAGGIGQPLSTFLKLSPYIETLALYDVVNAVGVAADLSHIPSRATVSGHLPKKEASDEDGLQRAFTGADLVVIPAGVPRKPGMTRDDLFKINAGIVRDLIEGVAKFCPNAFVLVISNPVNSTVPIAAEVLKKHGVFDPKKLFGVTNLDLIRAKTFTAEVIGYPGNPADLSISVIGGHSGESIVPLIKSSIEPKDEVADLVTKNLTQEKLDALVQRIQFGGDEVVKAKNGAGSATLSMAYAGYTFAESVLKAANGESGVVANTFVHLDGLKGAEPIKKHVGSEVTYFAVPVKLGADGVEELVNPFEGITEYEQSLVDKALTSLSGNIAKGTTFITGGPK